MQKHFRFDACKHAVILGRDMSQQRAGSSVYMNETSKMSLFCDITFEGASCVRVVRSFRSVRPKTFCWEVAVLNPLQLSHASEFLMQATSLQTILEVQVASVKSHEAVRTAAALVWLTLRITTRGKRGGKESAAQSRNCIAYTKLFLEACMSARNR